MVASPLPDLSGLTASEASFLELAMGKAACAFINEAHNAALRLRQSPAGSGYEADNLGELADAKRWLTMARQFERAAHRRSHNARRRNHRVAHEARIEG